GPGYALTGAARTAVGTLLVCGWIGFTVLGSLLHLLAVVVRVRDFSRPMPAPRPRFDIFVTALAAAGVAALAIAQRFQIEGLDRPATVLLIAAYAILAGRIAVLAGRVLTVARPSI
ncbi:MAG: hypothetical protein WBM00_08445, partial [Solirubrobacterales bacterium]